MSAQSEPVWSEQDAHLADLASQMVDRLLKVDLEDPHEDSNDWKISADGCGIMTNGTTGIGNCLVCL